MTPQELRALLAARAEVAVIDTRDVDAYAAGHLLVASSTPRDRLDREIDALVPRPEVPVVVADGSEDAARHLRARGFPNAQPLAGGTSAWVAEGGELFSGQYVPSKALGEFVERARRTPGVDPAELTRRWAEGDDVVVVDSRPIDEHRKRTIPGAICVPGAELVHRIRDLAPHQDTAVFVSCGGRTRSIVGAQSLIDAGLPNPVASLRNGTMGWTLAGLEVETGADRLAPPPSPDARRWAVGAAVEVAERHGLTSLERDELDEMLADREHTTYLFDVRTDEEYRAGHHRAARWSPGGQLVQATDTWMATRNARVVLADDDGVRATMTALWLRRLGWPRTYTLAPSPDRDPDRVTGPDPTVPAPSHAPLVGTSSAATAEQRYRDYLRWEIGLVDQVERDGTVAFDLR